MSGCRAVAEFKDVTDMQTIEISDDQLRLAFNSSHAPVWLVPDYIAYLLSLSLSLSLSLCPWTWVSRYQKVVKISIIYTLQFI